jgi:hypothetical protein
MLATDDDTDKQTAAGMTPEDRDRGVRLGLAVLDGVIGRAEDLQRQLAARAWGPGVVEMDFPEMAAAVLSALDAAEVLKADAIDRRARRLRARGVGADTPVDVPIPPPGVPASKRATRETARPVASAETPPSGRPGLSRRVGDCRHGSNCKACRDHAG